MNRFRASLLLGAVTLISNPISSAELLKYDIFETGFIINEPNNDWVWGVVKIDRELKQLSFCSMVLSRGGGQNFKGKCNSQNYLSDIDSSTFAFYHAVQNKYAPGYFWQINQHSGILLFCSWNSLRKPDEHCMEVK